jgi:antitoxin CptB
MATDRSLPFGRCPDEAPGAVADGAKAAEELRRLRWRARRGLLENDLLIGRFLERQGDALNARDIEALGLLLDLPDPVLFEMLLGRLEPVGELDCPAVRNLLSRLGSNQSTGV